jgi:hypothetical protein
MESKIRVDTDLGVEFLEALDERDLAVEVEQSSEAQDDRLKFDLANFSSLLVGLGSSGALVALASVIKSFLASRRCRLFLDIDKKKIEFDGPSDKLEELLSKASSVALTKTSATRERAS